ncbi:MAG TPA: tetratricopeptide repeat protein [Geobacteraceae bacterium]|nr:tetratricopeptide repeat protein [Geobacteraceae bacterium]
MFLKKLFNFGKDYNHYLEKGDRCLADERFADARNAYGEALEKIEASGEAALSQIEAVRQKIALTGNMLGRLNLVEAEHALSSGDRKKAEEHLRIIMDLADDATLRENSERLLAVLGSEAPEVANVMAVRNCGSCEGAGAETGNDEQHGMDDNISREDRLALYFQTLPVDLPERYAGMGEEFGRGCLLNLEGNGEGALRVFEELSADTENDILDYEKAILYFHKGDSGKCEQLLIKAIGLNPVNPLCNIGLVQLYTEIGREPEALQVLERMISSDLIPDQARLMQGDLYTQLQDESNAIESYSRLLTSPKFAREAAERIVPLLERQGRTEEAAYLAKKYAKGCC